MCVLCPHCDGPGNNECPICSGSGIATDDEAEEFAAYLEEE